MVNEAAGGGAMVRSDVLEALDRRIAATSAMLDAAFAEAAARRDGPGQLEAAERRDRWLIPVLMLLAAVYGGGIFATGMLLGSRLLPRCAPAAAAPHP